MTARPVRAVIYARISKDANGDALGVDRQIESCTLLARAREWKLVMPPLVDNDISAYSGKARPQYDYLLALIEARQIDAVICWHMDRLSRRVSELVDVVRLSSAANVRIATVQGDLDLSSPMGQMLATILTSVAEYESRQKGLREKAANDQAARMGKRRTATPRPFGYQADRVTAEPAEAEAIRWAAGALLEGSTVAAIAQAWTDRGLQPVQNHGSQFGRNSVTTILRNPRLAGYAVLPRRPDAADDYKADGRARPRLQAPEIARDENGEPVRGRWDAILDPDIWEAVNSLLADPGRKHQPGVRTLLGGLAECRCGNVITGSTSQASGHIYRCQPASRPAGDKQPHVSVKAGPVDAYVTAAILTRLARPDLADLLAPAQPGTDAVGLRRERAAIERNLEQMAADAVVGGYSPAMLQAASKRANARLQEIAADLAAAAGSSALGPFAAGQAAAEVWEGLDRPRRRAVIRELCSLRLLPAGKGARKFDPATVQIGWTA